MERPPRDIWWMENIFRLCSIISGAETLFRPIELWDLVKRIAHRYRLNRLKQNSRAIGSFFIKNIGFIQLNQHWDRLQIVHRLSKKNYGSTKSKGYKWVRTLSQSSKHIPYTKNHVELSTISHCQHLRSRQQMLENAVQEQSFSKERANVLAKSVGMALSLTRKQCLVSYHGWKGQNLRNAACLQPLPHPLSRPRPHPLSHPRPHPLSRPHPQPEHKCCMQFLIHGLVFVLFTVCGCVREPRCPPAIHTLALVYTLRRVYLCNSLCFRWIVVSSYMSFHRLSKQHHTYTHPFRW